MAHILILGGGFGGIAAARRLRELLPPSDTITLIDQRDYFIVGFRKTWAFFGDSLENGKGNLNALTAQGIQFVQGEVSAIEPEKHSVTVNGSRLEGDALIIALGAELAPDSIPGFTEHALNVYDPNAITQAAEVFENFQGGQVLVGVFGGAAYKCPPAPYEFAILAKEKLEKKGIQTSVTVFTPLPSSLPVLGPAGCNLIEDRLHENGIRFLAERHAMRVEPGAVVLKTGERLPFDLLIGVAPHRAPRVVREAGLTGNSGWIEVNRQTLETQYRDVYAIGDVTAVLMANGKPLPKAGVFAEAEGLVVAEHIAAKQAGGQSEVVFEGRGGCFLEVGEGKAVMVQGHFLAEGKPEVNLTEASEALFQEKVEFERKRLAAWFS
ncbi:MAG TPA: FAD-dependent oxidoreductase [Anaerolineales bacterium]|nr:FAD-dependent oxidoreductase [Anaerolineales bacterium]